MKRLTYEEIKLFIEIDSNSGCKLLSEEYKNDRDKLEFECKCGDNFNINYNTFKNGKRQCNKCGFEKRDASRRLSYEEVKYFVEVKSQSGCKLISEEYINSKNELEFKCSCGRNFKRCFDSFKSKHHYKCDKCSGFQNWIYEEIKEYVEDYNCELISNKEEYKTQLSKLKIKCSCGNTFKTSFTKFKDRNKHQCNDCGSILQGINNPRTWTYKQVKNIIEKNFNYILISDNYNDYNGNLIFKDNNEYFYFSSLANLLSNKIPSKYRKSNPYTIQNIKLWLRLNNKNIELISNKYQTAKKKLKWKCLKNNCNNIFQVGWDSILHNHGCPQCNESQGESKCRDWLELNNVSYDREYIFYNLKDIDFLRFDFAVFYDIKKTDLKCLIEYDGEGHYSELPFGKKSYLSTVKHDKMKNKYCKYYNIPLLRIPYWELDNIEEILINYFFNNNIISQVV